MIAVVLWLCDGIALNRLPLVNNLHILWPTFVCCNRSNCIHHCGQDERTTTNIRGRSQIKNAKVNL